MERKKIELEEYFSTSKSRIGLTMRENLSYANIRKNPNAYMLLMGHTEGCNDKRLCLKKVDENDIQNRLSETRFCDHNLSIDGMGEFFLLDDGEGAVV